MLQEIAPRKLINEFLPQSCFPAEESSFLIFRKGGELLCRLEGGRLELPQVREIPEETELRYLVAVDRDRFYQPLPKTIESTEAAGESTKAEREAERQLRTAGYEWHSARELRYAQPAWLRFGSLTAWQLAGWYQNNRFCGRCGMPVDPGKKERSLVCPGCGNTLYPKLCPVVIVAVTNGEKLLLTRYADRNAYARYALVAGFAEIGETIEETVAREVLEETGLKVKNFRYYKSQPWAYSESLLFGFFCDVDGSDEITVDKNELSSAEWVKREDIPVYDDEISLTHEMMHVFREGAY